MYYRERDFDADWLVLLLGFAVLVAAIMYNPPQPHIIAEGLSHALVVDAIRSDVNTAVLLYLPLQSTVSIPDFNVSYPFPHGPAKIALPLITSAKICVNSTEFNECGFIYPVQP